MMLILEVLFPAGRYHATPWGRHVNEGEPEWPPSPYRLVRALVDAWKRKRPAWDEARAEAVFRLVSERPPRFHLPPTRASHTRSFLSVNDEDPSARTLIFDGFMAVERGRPLLIGWPGAPDPAAAADLAELASTLNYLGRSESWVTVRVAPDGDEVDWNCRPAAEDASEAGPGELARVACVVPSESYQPQTLKGRELGWLDALAFSTGDLLAARAADPPALRFVDYRRPAERPRRARQSNVSGKPVHGVLYALESKVLPRATATIEIAERVRAKLMGIHAAVAGGPERVSPRFSGKNEDGGPRKGHRHAFILPLDEDRDGRLDHLLVFCREPLDSLEAIALDRLASVWQPNGLPDLRFVPLRWGGPEELAAPSFRLASTTPFVPARHYRRGRGAFSAWLEGEVRRECLHHGLPEPVSIRPLERPALRGAGVRWLEFRRNRKGEDAGQGYGFEMEFAAPVRGPVALGYGCHFGLGQFRP